MIYEDFNSSIGEHISDFLGYYKPMWAQSTYEHHRWHLLSLDSFLAKSGFTGKAIDEATVASWIKSLPPLADSTLQSYISSARKLFGYLSAKEISKCYIPPVRSVNQDYLPHYFTDSELDDMYCIIDDYPVGHRNKLPYIKAELPMVIRILESCGTRISETVSLQMKDVDLDRGVLTMMHAKGDKERYVPMSESLSQIMRKYCEAMGIIGKPEAFLFPRKDQTECLDKYEIENRFPYIRKWTGIEAKRTRKFERNICLHCFRHCFAIKSFKKLESEGVHLNDAVPYLSIYLGHNKLKETEKYLSFSAEMYPDELENFENIMETNLPDDAMWDDIYGEVTE